MSNSKDHMAPDNNGSPSAYPPNGELLFGKKRFSRYLSDAHGDYDSAMALALYNQQFAGLLHSQLGIVALAVRNAMDRKLQEISLSQYKNPLWTSKEYRPQEVNALIGDALTQAYARAERDIKKSISSGSRSMTEAEVTQDDVIAHLMWGTWVKLVGTSPYPNHSKIQQQLWKMGLCLAFPHIPQNEFGRKRISSQLFYLRNVRNKEAHFDNLYQEAFRINYIIGTILSVLAAINPQFTHGWINTKELRSYAHTITNRLKD